MPRRSGSKNRTHERFRVLDSDNMVIDDDVSYPRAEDLVREPIDEEAHDYATIINQNTGKEYKFGG